MKLLLQFGIPPAETHKYGISYWATAYEMTPEKAVIYRTKYRLHGIVERDGSCSYFDKSFSKHMHRDVVAPRVKFDTYIKSIDDGDDKLTKPLINPDEELLELLSFYYRGSSDMCAEFPMLIFERDYVIDRETQDRIHISQTDIVRVGLDFSEDMNLECLNCINFDELNEKSAYQTKIAIYFGEPLTPELISAIDDWAVENDCTIKTAMLDSFKRLIDLLSKPKVDVNYFDITFTMLAELQVLAPKVSFDTHVKDKEVLPMLWVSDLNLTHANTKKLVPISNDLIKKFGREFESHFGYKYVDYTIF